MTAANVVSYAAQVAVLVLACAGLPRLLGLRLPGVQYVFWRTLLVVCLLLPVVQPWRPAAGLVPAPPLERGTPGAVPAAFSAAEDVRAEASFGALAAARVVILAGIAARLAWMGIGIIRLRRMRRRATEIASGFDDLHEAIGARAPILWSPDVRHPVTFGLLAPVVLLPAALRAANLPAQRAVVAHELHHVRRRDWGWIVAEEIVRSVFWFHPAMWWLVSRVQLARETVVDELSILSTNARRVYLDTLLAFADDTGLASPPAFSARRHLFHRVMLLSKEGDMSSIRVAFASGILILALGGGAWSAVEAFPLHGGISGHAAPAAAQTPPRDSPSAGHRISLDFEDADLRAVLRTFANETGLEMIIDPQVQGRVNLLMHDVPWDQALDRILRSNKLGYTVDGNRIRIAPLGPDGKQSQLQKDNLRQLALARANMPPPPPPAPRPRQEMPPSPPAAEPPAGWTEYKVLVDQLQPVRVGGELKPPMKLKDVRPEYPADARAARVQGVVIIESIIGTDGDVLATRVLRSIPMLDEAALAAVRQWKFTPTLINGAAVPVMMTVTVNFTLQ